MPRAGRLIHELTLALKGIRLRFALANLVCGLMPQFTLSTARAAVYRLTGMRIGPHVSFMHTVAITGSGPNPCRRLSIGAGSIISTNVLLNLQGEITIGENVNVSQFVRIYTSRHRMGPSSQRFNVDFEAVPVVIEDGAWIGSGVVILPGVTVGRGSVISAGSVVNRDVPPDTLVSGVPAAVVRELPPD